MWSINQFNSRFNGNLKGDDIFLLFSCRYRFNIHPVHRFAICRQIAASANKAQRIFFSGAQAEQRGVNNKRGLGVGLRSSIDP